MSISLRRSTTRNLVLPACVVVAALVGRLAFAADAERMPVAPAKPEMRLLVGPRQLFLLLQTEIMRSELALTPEQVGKVGELRQRRANYPAPDLRNATVDERVAWSRQVDTWDAELFVDFERLTTPAQKTRLDELALQLYLPYVFYASHALELDDYLQLTPEQRRRTHRYARDNCSSACSMYTGGDEANRAAWDAHRAEEQVWRTALLAELTAEQRAELRNLTGKEVRLQRLQEQIWNACLAQAMAEGRAQDPKPDPWQRDPATGRGRALTDKQDAEIRAMFGDHGKRVGGRIKAMPIAVPAEQ